MMFPSSDSPRVFATAVGRDFCADLIVGLDARLADAPPHLWPQVRILVANGRMLRRLHALFLARGAGLMPRLRTVQSLGQDPTFLDLPTAEAPLSVRLDLAALVSRLIDQQPNLAPRSALYDLADSLADLMGEMFEEGVTPADLAALDISDHATHWQRSLQFLNAIAPYFRAGSGLTAEARQSQAVDALIGRWRADPPDHPIVVAGSTGSRGATARLMEAVAQLPQGAVILPGLDRHLPPHIWNGLLERRRSGLAGEDHPQYRLARFAAGLGLAADDLPDWHGEDTDLRARTAAVSLALRPAPVTNQWRDEGPRLTDLARGFASVTLVEAPNPTVEAAAIALRLREAVENNQRAALIAAEPRLVRMVSAALDRWGILPDVSAGQPVLQTSRGRFLGHVVEAMIDPLTPERLVTLLQHPTCHSGKNRFDHLKRSRAFELDMLRTGLGLPDAAAIRAWAKARPDDPDAVPWAAWLEDILSDLQIDTIGHRAFGDWVAVHIAAAHGLAAGADDGGHGNLYEGEDGAAVTGLVSEMQSAGSAGAPMTGLEYRDLFLALAEDREARQSLRPHADVLIWGTQEARVQGADLMILSGLNEGTWPAAPRPDPWLNREMRATVGLRLPDRSIGLAAHDFQQAMAAREVWMTRAVRDDETNTVPSRWLNRLTNLLDGSGDEAKSTLAAMRVRGDGYIAQAQHIARPSQPVPHAPRPAPCPPASARPDRLSVTQVERLVRDPYAVYARYVLRLRPLEPLRAQPDAALRGTALHEVMERFVRATRDGLPDMETATAQFLSTVDAVLADTAPWPANRRLWRARFARVAPWFLNGEVRRRAHATPWLFEEHARWPVPGLPLTLTARADRIDRLTDGRVAIYDYKSGKPPTPDQEDQFNQQLWLTAIMAADGGFAEHGPLETAEMAYIGLGSTPKLEPRTPTAVDLAERRQRLAGLLGHYLDPAVGFPSRRAVQNTRWPGDYDQLARYGEWDETDPPQIIPVGDRS